jgi:hypothetical protein
VRLVGPALYGGQWSADALDAMTDFPATSQAVDAWTDEPEDDEDIPWELRFDPPQRAWKRASGEFRTTLHGSRGEGEHWDRAIAAAAFVVDALAVDLAYRLVDVTTGPERTRSHASPTDWQRRVLYAPGFARVWFEDVVRGTRLNTDERSCAIAPWLVLVSRDALTERLAAFHRSEATTDRPRHDATTESDTAAHAATAVSHDAVGDERLPPGREATPGKDEHVAAVAERFHRGEVVLADAVRELIRRADIKETQARTWLRGVGIRKGTTPRNPRD